MSERLKKPGAPDLAQSVDPSSSEGSTRLALQRKLAGLPYAEQVAAVSPGEQTDAPLQLKLDPNSTPDSTAVQFARGGKGKSFRGGKKKNRDNWYGYNDKGFQRWWHREGKAAHGGDDIESAEEAKAFYDEWVALGKPVPK